MKSLGMAIRERRVATNMTQEELAKRIGKKEPIISMYETGAREIPLPVLVKIAEVLDMKDAPEVRRRLHPQILQHLDRAEQQVIVARRRGDIHRYLALAPRTASR